ncbi:MAG: tripartite tricarboxylate transporter permease [Deltaproteobacteria bacterium]|nr:tripartite tricarboxylate transporter permease [Deltaproteobacteria bacterium]
MEIFSNLLTGFSIAGTWHNLLFCFIGVFFGTLVGVLPGIGPLATMSILLPVTFGLSPTTAIIMLSGIYYGAYYGGSTTSILVNIPGEAASVITCLDGYKMALQGRAGPALGIAAFGSFIAGTVGLIILQTISPALVTVALKFGAPEYFSLMILGLVVLTFLTEKSMAKALLVAAVGVIMGTVGLDSMTGTDRFSFGIPELLDGVGIVPMAMGLFGITEILVNLETDNIQRGVISAKLKGLLPSFRDWMDSIWAIIRGTIVGFGLGMLPGGGGVIASFASYAVEKMSSKHPERFGHGAIQGVAGPESANNAAASAGFVPLLTLGIPVGAVQAVLLGALMIHGITPGPMLLQEHPDLFWGVIASMYIGNVMLLVLNLPLIGLWVKVLKVPYNLLFPMILFFCMIGSYTVNNSTTDVGIMLLFGVVGYFMRKFGYEPAPMILAFVLSPILERSLRQSLLMSSGSFNIFLTRPISLACLILASLLLALAFLPMIRKKREEIVALEE